MRGARGSGKAAPSSPSVDALAAIAARKAAKIEKSLNKVPAMQLIADQLAQENAMKASQRAAEKTGTIDVPSTTEDVEMESDANSDDESASSVHDKVPEPAQAQAQAASLLQEEKAPEAQAPSSTHCDEDVDMVDADLLADFDLDSGSEKEFFMEQLRVAPPEEVDLLLSSLKRTAKPSLTKAPTPTDKTDKATQSLLKLEVADFAQKRAAALPQRVPTKEQLNDFKEEVYMYGLGLNLGETQALLAAAKAEADVVKARGMKTMKNQLAMAQPPIEAINKTIEHFTKIQDVVGELFKDLPQSQGGQKPEADAVAAAKATANKRKRSRKSKGGADIEDKSAAAEAPAAEVPETSKAAKRQKTSPEAAPKAAPVEKVEQTVADNDAPKLTRKQKQELYRQELEKKRPIIAKKVDTSAASTTPESAAPATAPSITPATTQQAPAENTQPQQAIVAVDSKPAQKTRQRARKSAAQKQLEKAANHVISAPAPSSNAASAATTTPATEADGFVDMRAPKKKKRGRKSTGAGEKGPEAVAAPQPAPTAAILPENQAPAAEKPAAPVSVPEPAAVLPAPNADDDADKDNKNKSRRQSKINKRKYLASDTAETATAIESTPAKAVASIAKPAAVKQTPIPPPSRAILPPPSGSDLKPVSGPASSENITPASVATPATSVLPPKTAILPPSSVSKLVLNKSPVVAAASTPILPGATPKAASTTPLGGISAPNSSGKGRKRGPRKSDVSAVETDEPKENHSIEREEPIPTLALDEHNGNNEDNSGPSAVKESVKLGAEVGTAAFEDGSESTTVAHSLPASPVKTPTKRSTKSPHFGSVASKTKRLPAKKFSCIPFPPLSSPQFGLIQEKLADDPFKLLIGVTFLIKTAGKSSIPVFYRLLEMYPTIEDLANANKADIVELTRHLGLQNSRADTYVKYANIFLHDPPVKGKRYRVENYPTKKAHQGIAKGEILADNDDDPRDGAWEIGHLTKGAYALDSWRIFCRDKLRGLATGWNGEGAQEGFQPEWMRVMPQDKELRAFLRWYWLREGWLWNADTGEREVVDKDFVDAINQRRVVWEWQGSGSGSGKGNWRILSEDEKQPDYT